MDDDDSTLPPLTLSDIYGDEDLLQPPPHGSIISAASADKDEDDAASLVKETPPASSPDSGAASLGVGSATCSVGMEDGGTTADGIEGHDDFSVPVCIGDLIVSENQCKGQKPSVAADREDSLPELTRSMADLCTASPSAGGACCDGKCKPGQCKCPETCKGCPQADNQDQDDHLKYHWTNRLQPLRSSWQAWRNHIQMETLARALTTTRALLPLCQSSSMQSTQPMQSFTMQHLQSL